MADEGISDAELKKLEIKDDEDDELTPGYKAPAKVDVNTLQNLDANDESLVKYKKTLLGPLEEKFDEGGLNVLVKFVNVLCDGRDPIPVDLSGAKGTPPIVVKEGCKYNIEIGFRVQREIVSGLKFANKVFRKGIRVDNVSYMVGSYGPKKEPHTFKTPRDDAPKGMLARGTYEVKGIFTDDDKEEYLSWSYQMKIAKDWN